MHIRVYKTSFRYVYEIRIIPLFMTGRGGVPHYSFSYSLSVVFFGKPKNGYQDLHIIGHREYRNIMHSSLVIDVDRNLDKGVRTQLIWIV